MHDKDTKWINVLINMLTNKVMTLGKNIWNHSILYIDYIDWLRVLYFALKIECNLAPCGGNILVGLCCICRIYNCDVLEDSTIPYSIFIFILKDGLKISAFVLL